MSKPGSNNQEWEDLLELAKKDIQDYGILVYSIKLNTAHTKENMVASLKEQVTNTKW